MRSASPDTPSTRSHKPRAFTVFAAAFVAGAAAAVGVNSLLDVRLAQAKPRVESEPIFVALRSLPQGAPVTVWDVALRDWPRAMVPTSALRASDAFSGLVLKHPLREGQPLLSIQLVEADATVPSPSAPVTTISTTAAPATTRVPDADLWAPAAPATVSASTVPQQHAETPRSGVEGPRGAEQSAGSAAITDAALTSPAAPTTTDAPRVDDAVATVAAPQPTSAEAMVPAVPQAVSEENVAAAPAADEAFTDEILEAMAATATPAAETFVTAPDETVIGAPAVAASPSDGGMPPRQDAERSAANAADTGAPIDAPTPATTPAAEVVVTPSTPTLADPPLAAIDGPTPFGSDGTTRSVMRPVPADAAPAPVPAPPRVARYLVVPENIALQADASFAAVRQPVPQQQPHPRPGAAAMQPLPPTAGQQPAKQPTQRASQPRRGTSAAASGGPQRPVAPQQSAEQQPRRGMFPNIAAGIETIDAELGRMRRDRTGQADQSTSGRPRPQY